MAVLQGEEVSLARGGFQIQKGEMGCERQVAQSPPVILVNPQVPKDTLQVQNGYVYGYARASKEAEILIVNRWVWSERTAKECACGLGDQSLNVNSPWKVWV